MAQDQDRLATAEDLTDLGLTYRQVDYWTRMGWLKPDNPEPGTGKVRRYGPDEVRVAALMSVLVTEGEMSPAKASAAARHGGFMASGLWVLVRRGELVLDPIDYITRVAGGRVDPVC